VLSYGDGSIRRDLASELWIDAKEGMVGWLQILPEHEEMFEPFVQAAGGWPSATAVPTPIVARLGEHAIVVPDGIVYYPPDSGYPGPALFAYGETLHVSRLYVDENGQIVKQEILPEHLDQFAPLLKEFSSSD
jgi:hypothetical protein